VRCGLVYTTPKPFPGEIDLLAESHPDSVYALSAGYKAKWMSDSCPNGHLLEIGCGKGHFLHEAGNRGFDVSGLEPDETRALEAKVRYGLRIHRVYLEEFSDVSERFDVVYHCDLLAHFPDPLESIEKMKSLLTPNGVLCFEIGIMAGVTPLWYRYIGRIGLGPHLWFYSRRALHLMLAQAGLELVRLKSHGLLPRASLGRFAEFVLRRGVYPLVRSVGPLRFVPSVETLRRVEHSLIHFLRYNVGGWFPRVGPETLFVVARPVRRKS
jgi:SAM-dependent methyltransferase